jgi:hypothetical protein
MRPVEELANQLLVIGEPSPVLLGLFPCSHASDWGDKPAVDVVASVVFVVVKRSLPECGGECSEAETGGSTQRTSPLAHLRTAAVRLPPVPSEGGVNPALIAL